MISHAIFFALLLQTTPVAAGQASGRAAISGIVVSRGTGQPVPNVEVSLARTDSPIAAFLSALAAGPGPGEITLPAEFFAAIRDQAGQGPPEAAALAALPINDVHEVIVSASKGIGVVYKSSPPMMTDSQGRFSFQSVEPGTYRVIFAGDGYAKEDFGQRLPGGAGTPIVMTAGDAKTGIVMRLSPVGAISGRILDDMARPVAGVPVQLLHFSYDDGARKKAERIASARTDDRGEYRLYLLSPGRYYLAAGNQSGPSRALGFPNNSAGPLDLGYLSPNRIEQNYSFTYYPGVPDAGSAAPIDLQPGADLNGIDLFLDPQQTFRVSGRVVDSAGSPPRSAIISLRPQTADLAALLAGLATASNYTPDGAFEVPNVAPGSYLLTVEGFNPFPRRPDDPNNVVPAAQPPRDKGIMLLNVGKSDLNDLTVTIGSTAVSGQLHVDGTASNSPPGLERLRVQLRSNLDTGPVNDGNQTLSGSVKADGTFNITGIATGEYRVSVSGLPQGSYVKQARLGQTDVLNVPLKVSAAESDGLDIVIGSGTGEISGTAVDMQGRPAAGVQVVLIPEENRNRTDLFRPVVSDVSGHFTIPEITPGSYKLASWESIEPFGFFDPDLLKVADESGKPVRVTGSSKQNVTVTAW
jgi:hypothetical protein